MNNVDKIAAAFITLALVATLVSSNSQTATALQNFFSVMSNLVQSVMKPAATGNANASKTSFNLLPLGGQL